jgi:hypothetical protein
MLHVTIVEFSETFAGGLYVLAEFRRRPSDRVPFTVEDFTWQTMPGTSRRRVVDRAGRVRIGGRWVFPNQVVAGDLVARGDLETADVEPITAAAADVKDRVMAKVLEFAGRLEVREAAGVSVASSTAMRSDLRPARRRPGATTIAAVGDELVGSAITETLDVVNDRRRRTRETDVDRARRRIQAVKPRGR